VESSLVRKAVIWSFDLSINTAKIFSSTNNLPPSPTLVFFANPKHDVKSSTCENTIVVASYLLSHTSKKRFFKAQSSSSTMRAAIILVGLGAIAVNAGVLATETETLSATTTVTILSCHPTVTNCPVSPLSRRFQRALRLVYFRDTS
jgi:hypothetical protein